jgi:multiple antibiotic resistance protein
LLWIFLKILSKEDIYIPVKFTSEATGFVVTILSIAIVIGITYIILLFVNPIYRLLGRRGSMIVTRVFAIFIAAIAVQYVIEGAKRLFV